MEIGSCWAMEGPKGQLSVRFASKIRAQSITLDHIHPQVATDFSSAPHQFHVVVSFSVVFLKKKKIGMLRLFLSFVFCCSYFYLQGLVVDHQTESIVRIPLGDFSYLKGGSLSQTFATDLQNQNVALDGMTLVVDSNFGNAEFTCLYRFRVHGKRIE